MTRGAFANVTGALVALASSFGCSSETDPAADAGPVHNASIVVKQLDDMGTFVDCKSLDTGSATSIWVECVPSGSPHRTADADPPREHFWIRSVDWSEVQVGVPYDLASYLLPFYLYADFGAASCSTSGIEPQRGGTLTFSSVDPAAVHGEFSENAMMPGVTDGQSTSACVITGYF